MPSCMVIRFVEFRRRRRAVGRGLHLLDGADAAFVVQLDGEGGDDAVPLEYDALDRVGLAREGAR